MTFAQVEMINAGLALLWLVGAILVARANRPKETYQLRRVPRTVAASIGGHALIVIVVAALAGRLGIVSFHLLLLGVLIFGMVFFLWVLIVDALATLLRAERTAPSLAGGIALMVLFAYGWLFLVGGAVGGAGLRSDSPVFFTPGLLAAAAGLIWWSELPRPDEDEAGVFE